MTGARDRMLAGSALTERIYDIAGTATSVLEAGDGPPMVLLHGAIECGGVMWTPAVGDLVNDYRLIIPDVPGLFTTQAKEIPRDGLSQIGVPTALLWGRDDRMVPRRMADSAAARRRWPLFTVEDAAHVPHIEQPEAFVDALRAACAASKS